MARALVLAVLVFGAGAFRSPRHDPVSQKFDDLGHHLKKVTAKWHKDDNKPKPPPIPAHIKNRTRTAEVNSVMAVSSLGGCGAHVALRKLGLKKSAKAAKMWKQQSLLATAQLRGKGPEHPGRDSFSVPGAGATQTLADEGRSTTGTVNGEEPYVTVLKDGFFEVGCYYDTMLTAADKFGNDADKYKIASDVSIALYSELVLDENKDAMTPTVCFEFCRTLPDMGFFGIADGRTCYCTPYYQPRPGDQEQCNAPCEGDTSVRCGNMQGKSSIFEMHLCADTATDLADAMTPAKEALDYFMETALLAQELGEKMAESGKALQTVGGLSGGPGAADMGQVAMVKSKALTQAFMGGSSDSYTKLLTAYKLGKDQENKDFTVSTEAIAAERATRDMKKNTGAVVSGAASTHEALKLAYPVLDQVTFGNEPDGGDAAAMKLKSLVDGDTQAEADFRVASYAFEKAYAPKQSSCKGPVIGSPMVGLGQKGCALACEATVYPDQCVAYSFYSLTGADDLCFLLMEVEVVETFTCPTPALLQKNAAEADSASAFCGIKMSILATGYKPMSGRGKFKKNDRCFGKDAGIALKQDMEEYDVPSASSLTLGAVTLEAAP